MRSKQGAIVNLCSSHLFGFGDVMRHNFIQTRKGSNNPLLACYYAHVGLET